MGISSEGTSLTTESSGRTLCQVTGALFLIGALSFAAAATFCPPHLTRPDILRQPADVLLTKFAAGGPGLVWTWFATAWTIRHPGCAAYCCCPLRLDGVTTRALWVARVSLARSQPCSL